MTRRRQAGRGHGVSERGKSSEGGWRRRGSGKGQREPHVALCVCRRCRSRRIVLGKPEPDAWPELRLLTLSWVRSHSVAGSLSQVPAFLRTKIAVIFALLLQSCFPQQWASPVSDLAAVVQDGSTARCAAEPHDADRRGHGVQRRKKGG